METKNITVEGEIISVREDGVMIRISRGGRWRNAGEYETIGAPRSDGYCRVAVKGKSKYVHRLVAEAWIRKCEEGEHVHHLDGDKSNNHPDNLDIMDRADHQRLTSESTSSEYLGVSWHRSAGKWESHIKLRGTKIHIGLFDDEEEAARARDAEYLKHHPSEWGFYNFKPVMFL